MLNITKDDVSLDPFPHVISETILQPDFYKRLRADYPDYRLFEDQKEDTGSVGSRTNQGFDIYRGDVIYEQLIERSDAWREFDAFVNSRHFVEKFVELFGDQFDAIKCRYKIDPDAYDRSIIEPREVMTARASLGERLGEKTRRLTGWKQPTESLPLFSRLDIHKALKGYEKPVHCDRPNRLCTFVMYFCDAEEQGFEGGNLTIHKHRTEKDFSKYERHPKPADAPVIAELRPKHNLGVIFPCCNNSYHGVTAVTSKGVERDYLYINISAEGGSLW